MNKMCHLVIFAFVFSLTFPVAAFAAENFIAQSPDSMSWSAAKNFCESKGGKLPLVNNEDVLENPDKGMSVDGFGVIGDPWSAGVDGGKSYWLGTTPTAAPHRRAHVVGTSRGMVNVSETMAGGSSGVVCVPK